MKIVRLMGGIGNQMFQYALYVALKKRFPKEEVLLDYSYFASVNVHNGLELEKAFGLNLPQATFGQLLKVTLPVYNYKVSRFIFKFVHQRKSELEDHPTPSLIKEIFKTGDRYYIGYWQDYRYIIDCKEELQHVFQFKMPLNRKTEDLIKVLTEEDNSVSLHIRRGDYLQDAGYAGLCGIDYYKQTIDFILDCVANAKFYVFSDDLNWCKENIIPLLKKQDHVFVDWNKKAESPLDILLMSKCKHNIIANSSFSWWAAFLNTNKEQIVCAPKKWTNHKVYTIRQLPEWNLF